MEIDGTKTETASKPGGEDADHQTQEDPSRSLKPRHASSTSSHQDELMVGEEETRAVAEALE